MSQITFKKVGLDNVNILQNLAIETFRQTFSHDNSEEQLQAFFNESYTLPVLKSEITHAESDTYFVYLDTDLVGYLKVNWGSQQTEKALDKSFEIQRIYLLDAYQGKGIGKATFEFALDLAYKSGLDWAWLGVWEFNHKAQAFYAKYGFEKFSEHQFSVGDKVDTDWLLRKSLH
ncbi:GNAT family N-acetyltransferase [Streptococcus agalactiae]|uniref:GNAT family N-acetyltransferase n=1 Tax=Streptococcus agalactiae TaxID=1311 RepID=UPI00362967AD